jgi:hypothetical protein
LAFYIGEKEQEHKKYAPAPALNQNFDSKPEPMQIKNDASLQRWLPGK